MSPEAESSGWRVGRRGGLRKKIAHARTGCAARRAIPSLFGTRGKGLKANPAPPTIRAMTRVCVSPSFRGVGEADEPGIRRQSRCVSLDSGFAPPISGLPEIGLRDCPSRLKPTWVARPGMTNRRGGYVRRILTSAAARRFSRFRRGSGRKSPPDRQLYPRPPNRAGRIRRRTKPPASARCPR